MGNDPEVIAQLKSLLFVGCSVYRALNSPNRSMQKSYKVIQSISLNKTANTSLIASPYKTDCLDTDHCIVCGLGRLGQGCVMNLQKLASLERPIRITAVDKVLPKKLTNVSVPGLLKPTLIIGDCREDKILEQAGIRRCRSILLLSDDENANIEAAFAARRLNPLVRLVVRSSRPSLNRLLEQQLTNCAALDAAELPATAFAVAGLGDGAIGAFSIGEHQFRVVERQVQSGDPRFDRFPAYPVGRTPYCLLTLHPSMSSETSHQPVMTASPVFHRWRPDAKVKAGDWITYVEVIQPTDAAAMRASVSSKNPLKQFWRFFRGFIQLKWRRNLWQWIHAKQIRQMVFIGLVMAFCLELAGTLLLKYGAGLPWQQSIFSSVILLLGGYGDLFGGPQANLVPWWVELFSLLITIVSTLVVLGTLGFIAEPLLSSEFEFLRKRRPIPQKGHVVVIGLGRIGRRVASLLQEFKQPFVALTMHPSNRDLFPEIPLLIGDIHQALTKVNLAQAKSIIALTDDQILNLEAALIASEKARKAGRELGLIIRTQDQRLSENLTTLLPSATALHPDVLSAQAYAAAAFGEKILGLFPLHGRIILVTEHYITDADTLVGKLLAEVAYGYDVIPIFYQTVAGRLVGMPAKSLIPSDIERLRPGDRVVLLSSINSLRKIERGDIKPPRHWNLKIGSPLNRRLTDKAAYILNMISGCGLSKAKAFMEALPGKIKLPLYTQQAYCLMQALRGCGLLNAELKPIT